MTKGTKKACMKKGANEYAKIKLFWTTVCFSTKVSPRSKEIKVKNGNWAHTQAITYQAGKSLLRKSLPSTLTGCIDGKFNETFTESIIQVIRLEKWISFEIYKIMIDINKVIKFIRKRSYKRSTRLNFFNLVINIIIVFSNRKIKTIVSEPGLTESEIPEPIDVNKIPR